MNKVQRFNDTAVQFTGVWRYGSEVQHLPGFVAALLISCASLLAAFPMQTSASTAVGTSPGSFGVTPTGGATYSIPINVPRGAGGLTPSIGLVYNSQSGEGAAGYGWTLSGLSAITRCNKTIDDDGSTEGITLTANDDYCLDGQRLRSTGSDIYDTEIRSFERITANTNSGATGGPSYWTVESKDGTTYEYGNTTDSKIFATNPSGGATTTVRVWALDKVKDASGNYYTLTYQNNNATTGDYWPISIQYTGNTAASTSPLHSITFSWSPRSVTTVQTSFVHGTLITQTQLLSEITVSYNGTTTFAYNLQYQNDPATGRNQLASITECAADGSCFPPTAITWQNGAAGWQSDVSTGTAVPDIQHAIAARLMDVNGDGIQDLVYPGSTDWMVMFGLPGGGFGVPVDTGIVALNYKYALVMDFNGDGRGDLMYPNTTDNHWHVLEATGNFIGTIFTDITTTLSDTGTNSVTGQPIYEGNAMTADYNGNGLSDFIYSDGINIYDVANTGGSFGTVTNVGSLGVISIPALGITTNSQFQDTPLDFDGSGRIGALTVSEQTRGTSTTYFWSGLAPTAAGYVGVVGISAPEDLVVPAPVDANGDGMSDLLWASPNGSSGPFYWNVNLSAGNGQVVVPTSITDGGDGDPINTDYYGDGRQEMFVYDNNLAWWMIRVNYDPSVPGFTAQTISTVAPYTVPNGQIIGSLLVGNISGDGLNDLVYAVGALGGAYTWHYRLHNGGAADLVTSITDGLGNTYTPQYISLSGSGGVYTKGSGAVYPVQDVQMPMQVVSSYQVSDGIGGTYTVNYSYSGAEMEISGHGFLGFASRTATDSRNGVTSSDDYDQTFPWIGEITQETITQSNGKPISTITNNYADQTSGSGSTAMYFPYRSSSTLTNYDINSGSAVKTGTTTNSAFDSYGDVTNSTTAVTDNTTGQQFSIQTATTYADSVSTTWCVSEPLTAIVTKSNPEGNLTRETDNSTGFDYTYCRPTQSVLEASNAQSLTTTYSDDSFGNEIQTTLSGAGFASRTTTTDYTTYNGEYPDKITNGLGQVTTQTWNPAIGAIATSTDANNHITTFSYNSFGQKTSTTAPDGSAASWSYNFCSGSCIANGVYSIGQSITNAGGTQTISMGSTVYDAKGRVIKANKTLLSGVLSHVVTSYDALGRVVAVSKPFLSGAANQYWTDTSYDVLNRPSQITAPASASAPSGDTMTINYSGFTTTSSTTAPNTAGISNETTVTTTDALGEIISKTEGSGAASASTSYSYDPFGDLISTTDADGHTTSMTYDGLGHKTAMTDPNMGAWSYTLDALGEITKQIDAKGQQITQSYDVLGRLTSRTEYNSGGSVTVSDAWVYDTAANGIGLLAVESDSNGFQKTYTYDSLSRPSEVDTTIPGNTTPYAMNTSYDSFGRVSTVTYPTSVAPSLPTANAVANPTTAPADTNTIILYGQGSTDPNGLTLSYQWVYTHNGPPANVNITSPTGAQTSVCATAAGTYTFSLIVSDENGSSNPAFVTVTFTAPLKGKNSCPGLSGGGVTFSSTSLGTGTQYAAIGSSVTLSKHEPNAVVAALDQERQTFAAHTPMQANESIVQAESTERNRAQLPSLLPPAEDKDIAAWNTWDTEYHRAYPNGPHYAPPEYIAYGDAKFEPASNDTNRFEVQYFYDDPASGALQSIKDAQTGFVYWQAASGQTAPVDAFGHLIAWTDGNNVSTVMDYDQATGVAVGISSGIGQSSSVQNLVYTWDGYGNLEERQDANQNLSESFQYDDLNRFGGSEVTNTAGTGPSVGQTYDAAGNILTKTLGGVVSTYSYDPNHPYAVNKITGTGGATTYSASYDSDGNMIYRNYYAVTWSVSNLPATIASAQGNSTFSYGPDHTRYKQSATYNGATTITTYIGGLFELVTKATSTQFRHKIMAGGQIVAVHTINQDGSTSTSYLHYDHLGSVDTITNDQGAVAQRMSFDAFGQRRDAANWVYDLSPTQVAGLTSLTNRGYTDQEQLDNVGLVHMNGRVYDPFTGRFISADPVEAGNRYAYVGNNPLARTDPSGYCNICLSNITNPVSIFTGIPMPTSIANSVENAIRDGLSIASHPSQFFAVTNPIVGTQINEFMARSSVARQVGGYAAMIVSCIWGPEVYAGYEAYVIDLEGGTPLQDLKAGALGYIEATAFDSMYYGVEGAYEAGATEAVGDYSVAAGWEQVGVYAVKTAVKAYLNKVVMHELGNIAARNGMNIEQLDAELEAFSFIGYSFLPSKLTVDNGQVNIWGVYNRGLLGIPFDAADVLLEYQGIPSATSWQYMFGNYEGMPLVGHSLGALTVNNIQFWGAAQGPVSVYALPFFNGAAYGTTVYNKPGDPVAGLFMGWLINPSANVVPGSGHSSCNYGIPNWNAPGCN